MQSAAVPVLAPKADDDTRPSTAKLSSSQLDLFLTEQFITTAVERAGQLTQ